MLQPFKYMYLISQTVHQYIGLTEALLLIGGLVFFTFNATNDDLMFDTVKKTVL